jgi:hypothetical protein
VLENPLARDEVGSAGARDETPRLDRNKSMVLILHGREPIWIFEGGTVALGDQRQGGGVGYRQIEAFGRRDLEAALHMGPHAMRTRSRLSSRSNQWGWRLWWRRRCWGGHRSAGGTSW